MSYAGGYRDGFRAGAPAHDPEIAELEKQNEELRQQLEIERMRIVACDVVAMSDTPSSAEEARKMLPEYRSAALESVIRRVDECIALRQQLANSIVIDMTKAPESSVELVKLLRANAESLLCQQAADEIEGLYTELHQRVTWMHEAAAAEIEKLRESLTDTLYFLERHSNRWDGVNGKHPHTVVEEARAVLNPNALAQDAALSTFRGTI